MGDVSVGTGTGVVAIVGAGLADDSDAMARALAAMRGIPVHMLSLSATGINLTIIVDADRVAPAIQRLHAAFFGSGAADSRVRRRQAERPRSESRGGWCDRADLPLAIVGMGRMGQAVDALAASRGCVVRAALAVGSR